MSPYYNKNLRDLESKEDIKSRKEYGQSMIISFIPYLRLKEGIEEATPSCKLCRDRFGGCYRDTIEEKVKCLKKKVILFTKGYSTLELDRDNNYLDLAIREFWDNIDKSPERFITTKEEILTYPKYNPDNYTQSKLINNKDEDR